MVPQVLALHVASMQLGGAGQSAGAAQQPLIALALYTHWLLPLHAAFWHPLGVQLPAMLQQLAPPDDMKPHAPPEHVRVWHEFPVGQSLGAQHAAQLPAPGEPPLQNRPLAQVQVLALHVAVPPQSGAPLQQPSAPVDASPQVLPRHVRCWQPFPVAQVLALVQQPAPPFDCSPQVLPTHVRCWHAVPVGQVSGTSQHPPPPFDVSPHVFELQVACWHVLPDGQVDGLLQQPPPPFEVKPHVFELHVRVWQVFPAAQSLGAQHCPHTPALCVAPGQYSCPPVEQPHVLATQVKLAGVAPQFAVDAQQPGIALAASWHVLVPLHVAVWQLLTVQSPPMLQQLGPPFDTKPHVPALHFAAWHVPPEGQSPSTQQAAHLPSDAQNLVPVPQQKFWSHVSPGLQSLVPSQQPAIGMPLLFFDVYEQELPAPLNADAVGHVGLFWQALAAAQVAAVTQQPASPLGECAHVPVPVLHVSVVQGSASSHSGSVVQQSKATSCGLHRLLLQRLV